MLFDFIESLLGRNSAPSLADHSARQAYKDAWRRRTDMSLEPLLAQMRERSVVGSMSDNALEDPLIAWYAEQWRLGVPPRSLRRRPGD